MTNADDDAPNLDSFRRRSESVQERQDYIKGNVALSNIGNDLDATMTFRINSGLKLEFDKLCRGNHSTISRELKRYMTAAIRSSKLL